ncbi:unnamed protein product [Leptidea sinapis]|uniref:C2H2-type domain-containing protein n=1 Tax=Leptidea sinapis TaxID=189913 RepID=A0A5E4QS08_9NEOP|nr:unnamed protein product [Leptidea sinapis]
MTETDMEEIRKRMAELSLVSFRKMEDIKKLAKHFCDVVNHPKTQEKLPVHRYLKELYETHRKICFKQLDGVEVEYIFTTEKKSNLQRQRFNSLPVSEVPELLKAELSSDNAKQVHICTDCDVEIELNDEEPLMESLQRHFNLDVHLPKLKRESIDVAEPIILPNMSRRLSALESGEMPAQKNDAGKSKQLENLDKMFCGKLNASLIRILPDNSEASVDAALKFYQSTHMKLCQEISAIDFSTQTSSVAPIIMSIKDNVNQNFSADANKNFDNDTVEPVPEKPIRNQVKKYRYYGPIEDLIMKLLTDHKLITLVDDRTGKLAFFCISCEYYTLRFRYDSVLNHVFSETHIHNLACILQGDKHISFAMEERTVDKIKEMNRKFLYNNYITDNSHGINCGLCRTQIEASDHSATIMHILEEHHLGRLSDKLYIKMKNTDNSQEDWGPKSLDWDKFLASNGKPLNRWDHVAIENFIKPSGKIANYCSCCDMTTKGPRQVLFKHIRQKKHLRNAAPLKLSLLYRNHCRPSEYYASFGNFYICSICPDYVAMPSFAGIVEHFDSPIHIETICKLIRAALFSDLDKNLLELNKITISDGIKCEICEISCENMSEAITHILSNVEHQNAVAESRARENRGDLISVYMNGHYVKHSEGAQFTCDVCQGVFNSIRSLLNHLFYANHFKQKLAAENVFRFYLELKHNINILSRNRFVYYEFGKLKCDVCDCDVLEENAKRHIQV